MSSSSKENSYATKKEDGGADAKIPKGMYSSRSWQGLKDPRIVRVSRSFGGKDRHSKVRTIKGLRDRRVRLSVQTAIQLYDLQDRLGLSQPSKAVDWLLTAAQHEINKLPPLPMPPEFFLQYPQPVVVSHAASAPQNPSDSLTGADIEHIASQRMRHSSTTEGNTGRSSAGIAEEHRTSSRCKQWSWCAPLRTGSREVGRAANVETNDWTQGNGQANKVPNEVLSASIPAIVPIPPHNYSSIPNTSYCHWNLHPNASNLTGHGRSSQSTGEPHNFSSPLLPPSFSLPFGSQLIFPSHLNMSTDSDLKQTSQIQMLSSSSQQLFPNSITSSLYSTPNQDSQSSLFLNQPWQSLK